MPRNEPKDAQAIIQAIQDALLSVDPGQVPAFWRELARLTTDLAGGQAVCGELLLSFPAAMKLLCCSRSTLRRMMRRGELRERHHYYRRGRRYLFHKQRLIRYVEGRMPLK